MAFWNRQKGRVYVYSYVDGKQKALSRDKVRHLDGQPDHNVQTWVQNYTEQFEKKKYNLDTHLADKKLSNLAEQFCEFLESRGRAPETVWIHRHNLTSFILPFFLIQEPPLTNPDSWPSKSIRLLEYLQSKNLTPNYISKVNVSLRQFWKWMQEEGFITAPYELRLRNPVIKTISTPLEYALTPDDVYDYVSKTENEELRFLALVGYFFSLRTFETWGLKRRDFRAGNLASQLECATIMQKHGLYNKFTVNISKQRRRDGEYKEPKSESKGWVACFNEKAAQQIVAIIKDKEPDEPILKFKGDWYMKLWAKEGIPNITLKDLRRASIYWLGHHTSFELIPLRNHARHKRAETTLLYLRRPEEALDNDIELNLEG